MNNIEKLEIKNQSFQRIDLASSLKYDKLKINVNTELTFINCQVDVFSATDIILTKKIRFENCTIGEFQCHATRFHEGFELISTIVKRASQFDCGGHNQSSHKIIIQDCIFEGYVDCFDIYCKGSVQIINNLFKDGTNLFLYLNTSYGIEEGVQFVIKNNQINGKLYE